MRLIQAMIYVKDLPRLSTFYAATLGLRPIAETRTSAYVEFDAGPVTFALHAIPPHLAGQIEITSPPMPREDNPMKLSFAAEDLAAGRRRLESLGVTILDRPWGAWDGVDPEGNIFAVRSHQH